MENGVNGVPGRNVLKPVEVDNKQEQDSAITLLLLTVDLTALATPNKPKIAIPKLVTQVI